MSGSPPNRRGPWIFLAGLACVLATGAHAQTAAPLPAANASAVGFYSPRTVLWLGRTAVLPFHSAQAPTEDSALSASTMDPSVVEIVRQPMLLSGATTGYLRVRALRVGRTRLTLPGSAAIDLEVRADPAAAAFAQIDVESARPRIVSPMPNAVVWGQFAVGVEVFDATELPPGQGVTHPGNAPAAVDPSGVAAGPSPANVSNPASPNPVTSSAGNLGPTVRLRLPNGALLDPVAHTGPEAGPVRHYQFNVPAADFAVGSLPLVAVSTPEGFTDVDRRAGRGASLESQPVVLRNLRVPHADRFWSGECESPAILGPTKDLYAPARPPRMGTRQPDVTKDDAASGGQAVSPGGNGWTLPVVIKDPGDYAMFIQARGDFAGGAYGSAALYLDNAEIPLGTVRLTGPKYQRLPVGTTFHLDAGPQLLTVAFRNGFNHGKENRSLLLDRFELARIVDAPVVDPASAPMIAAVPSEPMAPAGGDYRLTSLAMPGTAAPPHLSLLYPANGASAFEADAVVARLVAVTPDSTRLSWVDVLIDGQPQGVRMTLPVASEPLVFPLALRQIAPGRHTLGLRSADLEGHTTDTPPQALNVLADRPLSRGAYERAVFLLDRFAFGAEPRELAAVLTMGENAWLAKRLSTSFDAPDEQALLHMACKRYPHIDDQGQTTTRVLEQWIASENPVRSRFTTWVENHFSTWINKTEAAAEWHSHLDFCRLGVAPFADLLSASAHSPAMLVYLDQAKSTAGKLNENYAREIMELHTLGVHGGYSQTDVTALASVLNGWTVTEEATLPQEDASLPLVYTNNNGSGMVDGFRFAPVLSDGKGQRVFGMPFPAADPATRYDRVRLALEMLASHPSTAEHVCRKLVEHYVADPAPDALVHQLAGVYLQSGGDLGLVLRTMAVQPAFWNAAPKMAAPIDYGVRIARLCRAAVVQTGANPDQAAPKPEQVEGFLKKSGMGMFDRVTPDGYPQSDDAYADSNALLQRWHFMEGLVEPLNRLVPKGWRTPPVAAPAVPTTPAVADAAHPPTVPDNAAQQRFIDLAALRLTGRLLTPGSNQAALDVLGDAGAPDQYSQALLFVSLLPETSLR